MNRTASCTIFCYNGHMNSSYFRGFILRLYMVIILCVCVCAGLFCLMMNGRVEAGNHMDAGVVAPPLSAFSSLPDKNRNPSVDNENQNTVTQGDETGNTPSAVVDTMAGENMEKDEENSHAG